ncbi:MAG: hypothetical protein WCT85_00220 [Parachlamydiales bacterium]|jgi:tetratricopeptide (TPR) repeat protein
MTLLPKISRGTSTKPDSNAVSNISRHEDLPRNMIYHPRPNKFHHLGTPRQIMHTNMFIEAKIEPDHRSMHKSRYIAESIFGVKDPYFINNYSDIAVIADRILLPDTDILKSAHELMEKKEYEAATILIESFIELKNSQNIVPPSPPDISFFIFIGVCRSKQGNIKEALYWLEKALTLNSNHFECNVIIANIFKSDLNFERAEFHYRKALSSKNYESYEFLAEFLEERSKFVEAQRVYSDAIALFPDQKDKILIALQRVEREEIAKEDAASFLYELGNR